MTFEKSADSLERLILVARHIFTQALEFVDLLESDEKLTGDSKYLPGSTIGIVCQMSHPSEIAQFDPALVLGYKANTFDTRGTTTRCCWMPWNLPLPGW